MVIGVLTLLIGSTGIFMPDWIASGALSRRAGIAIIAVPMIIIVICLVVQQSLQRIAEAQQERREKEIEERLREQAELLREILRRQAEDTRRGGYTESDEYESLILAIGAYDALLGNRTSAESFIGYDRWKQLANLSNTELWDRAGELTRRALRLPVL